MLSATSRTRLFLWSLAAIEEQLSSTLPTLACRKRSRRHLPLVLAGWAIKIATTSVIVIRPYLRLLLRRSGEHFKVNRARKGRGMLSFREAYQISHVIHHF